MPALVAGIHVLATKQGVDGRDKPGHDRGGIASKQKARHCRAWFYRLQLASVAPGKRYLFETAPAKALRRPRDRLAAERLVELHRRLVVGQRPDHHALQSALREVAARR